MTNGTEKYIGVIEYLSRLYDYCNAKLFDGELVKPVITVQQDVKNKAYGWWSCGKVWKENADDEGDHELNITAQYLNRPIEEIAGTLIHEMCHQYAQSNNLQDTSRAGNYHNKLFKTIAEKHGLHVECMQTYGWAHITLTDEAAALIAEFVKDNPVSVIYRSLVFKGQTVKTSSTRKYICPGCGQTVRATKSVNIMCADCMTYMREE